MSNLWKELTVFVIYSVFGMYHVRLRCAGINLKKNTTGQKIAKLKTTGADQGVDVFFKTNSRTACESCLCFSALPFLPAIYMYCWIKIFIRLLQQITTAYFNDESNPDKQRKIEKAAWLQQRNSWQWSIQWHNSREKCSYVLTCKIPINGQMTVVVRIIRYHSGTSQ